MNACTGLADLTRRMERWVARITLACAWFTLIALVAVTALDVAVRQIAHVGSDALKEIESSLFLMLVMASLGYTYLVDGHVRIDILREKASPRTRAVVETAGCLLVLLPLCAILTAQGAGSALTSFMVGETLEAFSDLHWQWVIKCAVPLGFSLFFLAGASVVVRNLLFLAGRERAPAPDGNRSAFGGEPLEGDR
jgi:TRAP-type mannitol/chloroaromatic compound transport system permease small subunit